MDQLDALPVGEAVVDGVEIAALIALGLLAFVVHHGDEGALVGQLEGVDLERDRDRHLLPVRGDGDGPLVEPGRSLAPGVDLEPERLVFIGLNREWKAAPARASVFRDELHRFPSQGIGRGVGSVGRVDPVGPAGSLDLHVADREDLDGPSAKIRGVGSGRLIVEARPGGVRERG